jgi:hypothetical protein
VLLLVHWCDGPVERKPRAISSLCESLAGCELNAHVPDWIGRCLVVG